MTLPWSITTTIRNPLRNREILNILKNFENQKFSEKNQIKFQILLIQNKLYTPNKIPTDCQKKINSNHQLSYQEAKKIFNFNDYEDPPMRGRQSANPLNKLGFAIARKNFSKIVITPLGKKFLEDNYDIEYIFLKCFLKLQFPNPWSRDFSKEKGFNLNPFLSTIHLLNNVNKNFKANGLTQTEFSLFVPTLKRYDLIKNQIKKIGEYRKCKDKKNFIKEFAKEFYKKENLKEKKINNLFDYGDNIMRYFRLTNYFKISKSSIIGEWRIDLEPTKKEEINLLLNHFDGKALYFKDEDEYIKNLSDLNSPTLPWEKKENLLKIIYGYKNNIIKFAEINRLIIEDYCPNFYKIFIKVDLDKINLIKIRDRFQSVYKDMRKYVINDYMKLNIKKLDEITKFLSNKKNLNSREFKPEQFEKICVDIFTILNDAILIKPNYPVDENNEPLSHASSKKPDFECYYNDFNFIGEVTKIQSSNQWIVETQPVMRHLNDFENREQDKPNYCLFLAPTIHQDTFAQFFISNKAGGPYGKQKIIPLSCEEFSFFLKESMKYISSKKKYDSNIIKRLFDKITNGVNNFNESNDWSNYINNELINYKI